VQPIYRDDERARVESTRPGCRPAAISSPPRVRGERATASEATCQAAARAYLSGMTRIAILFATTEGQTAKIAQHLAHRVAEAGVGVDLHHVAEFPDDFDLAAYDGVLLGGSIHEGHYQRSLMRFVEEHADALSRRPTGLFTVCLAIQSPNPAERAEAEHFADQLVRRAGFRPTHGAIFAGALLYTQYNWLKRVVMQHIVKKEGGDTDASHDYEYTDWKQVDAFAAAFLRTLSAEPSTT